jgi:hypothetical protein
LSRSTARAEYEYYILKYFILTKNEPYEKR